MLGLWIYQDLITGDINKLICYLILPVLESFFKIIYTIEGE